MNTNDSCGSRNTESGPLGAPSVGWQDAALADAGGAEDQAALSHWRGICGCPPRVMLADCDLYNDAMLATSALAGAR